MASVEQDQDVEGRAILFLSNEHPSWPTFQHAVDGFREVVQRALQPVAFYQEFLDSSRFSQAEYPAIFRRWLQDKYRGRRLDLVVAAGQEVVAFLADGNPWPDVPVLYSDIGALTIDISERLPGATGVVFQDHFRQALAAIKAILPDTTRIGLIHGASAGERARFAAFASEVRAADLGLEPVDLAGLTIDDLLARVANQPPDTVLFLFSTQVDALGRMFQPMRACELVSAAANRPLFSLQLHELGCGIMGGLLRDFKVAGGLVGQTALKRLEGQQIPTQTLPFERYTTLAFDDRQLSRFDINARGLPTNSLVHFRQPSLWRDYRLQVTGMAVVGLTQTLLIAWLLVEHRQRRRAELEAREHLEKARQHLVAMTHLDRRAAMGEVTAAIAHELNQPIEAILHNTEAAEMMLDAGNFAPAEMRQILADIRRIDTRAGDIIHRMRGMLRKHEFQATAIDANEVTRETLAIVAPVAASKGVHVELDLGADLPPVVGDKIHLQQVLLNMLLNGIDATAGVPRERRSLLIRTAKTGEQVQVSVSDAGHGIPDDALARIFEPFFTTKGEGMGIGLSIARTIVEAHGGSIAARNNPEGGATVWFSLPVGVAA